MRRDQLPDYVIVGHLSLDSTESGERIGGTAAYAARAARLLGRRVGVVTAAPVDPYSFEELADIEFLTLNSDEWTRFENEYSQGKRRQRWLSTATEIDIDDVPVSWQLVPIMHMAPIAQEVEPEFAMGCPAQFNFATIQGWLRARSSASKVLVELNASLERAMRYLDAAVVSEEDVLSDPVLLQQLADSARVLVVTRGANGCDLFIAGAEQRVPTTPLDLVDPTGAGDLFAAAFFVRFSKTGDAVASAQFANRFSFWILEDRSRLDIDPTKFEAVFPDAA